MARFVTKHPVRVLADEVVQDEDGNELPKEWMEVKSKLSMGDRNKITGAILSVNQEERSMDVNLERYLQLILELSLTNWMLYARDDEDKVCFEKGKPVTVPYNREYIIDLDPDDTLVNKVVEEIGRLNPTLVGGETTEKT